MTLSNYLLNNINVLTGPTLVIIGWVVIYRNARKIATRSETKSLIDDVISILNAMESLATEYWLSGRQSRMETEQFIVIFNAKLLTLNSRLEVLKARKVNVNNVNIGDLYEQMTLDCEQVDRMPTAEKYQKVQKILEGLNNAAASLYQEFQNAHQPIH